MADKKNWATDTSLVKSPVKYALFIDKESYLEELKSWDIPNYESEIFIPEGKGACVNFFSDAKGNVAALVCLDADACDNPSLNEIHGILVHEAVHIWQYIRKEINEKRPSSEFEAYSLQGIAQNLFYLYDDLIQK